MCCGPMLHVQHGPGEQAHEGRKEPDAREIMFRRYARGEITEEQLQHMLHVLTQTEARQAAGH